MEQACTWTDTEVAVMPTMFYVQDYFLVNHYLGIVGTSFNSWRKTLFSTAPFEHVFSLKKSSRKNEKWEQACLRDNQPFGLAYRNIPADKHRRGPPDAADKAAAMLSKERICSSAAPVIVTSFQSKPLPSIPAFSPHLHFPKKQSL